MSQINTYSANTAELAIDDDLSTLSNTIHAWNADLWYKMRFGAVRCFTEVVIVQSHNWDSLAKRMDDTKVFVVDTKTGTESLCGVLKVSDVLTLEGQPTEPSRESSIFWPTWSSTRATL